jgi:hypothetical protein
MDSDRRVTYGRRVYSLDIKRCQHCVGYLAAVPLDEGDGFEVQGPAVVCTYCDGPPRWEHAVFVPRRWTDLLG